ncbi:MAG TPA: glycosyltransferase family 39 protein [Actinomycetota bacterium]|nr:glycosyltransferase family 39 protein [Actinomycetota bacterium]
MEYAVRAREDRSDWCWGINLLPGKGYLLKRGLVKRYKPRLVTRIRGAELDRPVDLCDRVGDFWSGRRGLVILVASLGLGLLLRIATATHYSGALDSDEAVVGLMAREILHGHFPVFYWGQQYGGTLEVFITAALFSIFGSSTFILKLVPCVLDGVACFLVWRVGRRTIGEIPARAASMIFWLWPASFVWSSIKARGFYGVALVLALLVMLLVIRLRDHQTTSDWLWLGLVLGLGWWTTPEILFVAVPSLVWLLVLQRRYLKRVALLVPGAVLGGAPWIVWNLENHLNSLRATPQPVPHNSYLNHLSGFFKTGLPGALGLRLPLSSKWIAVPWAAKLAYVVAIVALGAIAWYWRRRLVLPIAILVAYPFIFALSPYSWYLAEPRYLLLLSPVLALLVGRAITRWSLGLIAIPIVVALTIGGLVVIPTQLPFPKDFGPLDSALKTHGISHAFADYWIAYRLDFESKETVTASPISPIRNVRIDGEVRSRPNPAYIFFRNSLPEYQFASQLSTLGITDQTFNIGPFDIYLPDRKVTPPSPGMPQGPVEPST